MNKEINSLLLKADVGITNALEHPAVAMLLSPLGYTPEKLALGKNLLTTAMDLHQKQSKEYGEKVAASSDLLLARSEAHFTYTNMLTISRIAFKNETGIWAKLQLNGKRRNTYSGWIAQSRLFYSNLLNDETALSQIAAFGVTPEKLQAGLDQVKIVEAKLAAQKKETGEAQDATKARDTAVDNLQDWYSDFIGIARIALQSNPQFLEMLDIIEPS